MPKNLYAPVGVDLKSFLPEDLKRYAPEATYLLHAIQTKRVFYRVARDRFVTLKAEYLRNIMTRQQSKPLIAAMRQAELIDCDDHYIKGKKSFGYRLGAKLVNTVFSPTPTPPRIQKRLDKVPTTVLDLPVHQHLHHWLHTVTIDYEAAKQSLPLDLEGYNEIVMSLEMIKDRAFWCVPDTYGRVHTNVTSLKTSLRSFLRIGKGQERVEFVDIVNSQPLFLSVVIANYFNNDESLNSFYSLTQKPKAEREGEEEKEASLYDGHFHLTKLMNMLNLPNDVSKFNELTRTGKLYEQLQELWSCTRSNAKQRFFAFILFCKVFPSEYRSKFQGHFPNVLRVIDALKESDYCHCAHMLQRAEVAVVIHTACETLRKDFPFIPLLTIHDSIGTTPEHLDTVRQVLAESFRGTGIKPTLRIESQQTAQDAICGEIGVAAGDCGVGEFDLFNAV